MTIREFIGHSWGGITYNGDIEDFTRRLRVRVVFLAIVVADKRKHQPYSPAFFNASNALDEACLQLRLMGLNT